MEKGNHIHYIESYRRPKALAAFTSERSLASNRQTPKPYLIGVEGFFVRVSRVFAKEFATFLHGTPVFMITPS